MLDPLLDKDFLKKLDLENQKTTFAKVIALDLEENPIEEISGVVTQGNINIDGSSAVRRTCSLTLAATELNYNNYLWGLNTKIDLRIGVENKIDSKYPDIIWFKQGVYLLTSFSVAVTQDNYSISLQGKDKMCLLNGDIGGNLPMSVDFGTVDQTDDLGNTVNKKLKIVDIITGIVHTYGLEDLGNIYINDVPETGLQLMEYRGSNSMYYFINAETSEIVYILLDKDKKLNFYCTDLEDEHLYVDITEIAKGTSEKKESKLTEKIFNTIWEQHYFQSTGEADQEIEQALNGTETFYIVEIAPGQVAGYQDCDLIYSGDLVTSAGDTITSVLDKIVQQLGNFEYFYNLDGHFVFQEKKNYLNTSWNNIVQVKDEEEYAEDIMNLSAETYSFDNQKMISSFNLNPNFSDLKNDFTIWGEGKGALGSTNVAIHLRYAVDKKPIYYRDYKNLNTYISFDNPFCKKYKIDKYQFISYQDLNKIERINFKVKGYKYVDLNWTSNDVMANTSSPYSVKKTGREKRLNGEITDEDFDVTIGQLNKQITLFKKSKDSFDNTEYIPLKIFRTKAEYVYPFNVQTKADMQMTEYIENPEKDGESFAVKVAELNTDTNLIFCDWREIIYQMALDYNNYHLNEDFKITIKENNYIDLENLVMPPEKDEYYLYPEGKTGYEQYYIDLVGFWRNLYNPSAEGEDLNYYTEIANDSANKKNSYIDTKFNFLTERPSQISNLYLYDKTNKVFIDFRDYIDQSEENRKGKNKEENIFYLSYLNNFQLPDDFMFCYIEQLNGKRALSDLTEEEETYVFYDSENEKFNQFIKIKTYDRVLEENSIVLQNLYYYIIASQFDTKTGWNKLIYKSPEKLIFWFDFLDNDRELDSYAVPTIGSRTKVVNDTDVKAISYKEIFSLKFVDNQEQIKSDDGYTHYYFTPRFIEDNFAISTIGKSATEELNDLLNNSTYCTETISVTSAPIYYLEPNTLITIQDETMSLKRKYILNSISIPLAYNSNMTISGTRLFDTVY